MPAQTAEGRIIMINWKVRFKNPVFYVQLFLAIMTSMMAYMGITVQELTTWGILGSVFLEAVKNPYVLAIIAVSVWNAVNDPTTAGISDSKKALSYDKPNGE